MNVYQCLGFSINEQTIINKEVCLEDSHQSSPQNDIIENDEYVELIVPLSEVGSGVQYEHIFTQGDSVLSGNYEEIIQKANENMYMKIHRNSSTQTINTRTSNIRKTLMKHLF